MVKKMLDLDCFVAGDGTHLRELVHSKNGDQVVGFSLAHAFLNPGESSLPHRLRLSSETYFILAGQGIICVEGEEYPIEQNDTVVVPVDALQFVKNTGISPLFFLCIVSPPWSAEEEEVNISKTES